MLFVCTPGWFEKNWAPTCILFFLCTGSEQHVTCERSYYKLGCYQDRQWSRAMSKLLISDRVESNQGQSVDWINWEDYLHGLAQNSSEEDLMFCYPAISLLTLNIITTPSCLSYGTVAESTEPLKTSLPYCWNKLLYDWGNYIIVAKSKPINHLSLQTNADTFAEFSVIK